MKQMTLQAQKWTTYNLHHLEHHTGLQNEKNTTLFKAYKDSEFFRTLS